MTNTVLRAVVFGVLGLLPLAALGALIAGIMLSGHPVSDRFSDALVSVRELLLVAIFIQIGLAGLPDADGFFTAGVLTVLLVAKAGLFIVFLQRVGMSNRTSALDGLTLANYSEFGLIIISGGRGRRGAGAVVAADHGRRGGGEVHRRLGGHALGGPYSPRLAAFDPGSPGGTAHAGRAGGGRAALRCAGAGHGPRRRGGVYRRLSEDFGKRVYSVEFDEGRIEELRRRGKKITSGDVTDPKLWRRIELDCEPQLFVLALPGHREGMALIEAIRRHHPRAVIASTTLTEVDRGGALLGGGADVAVYLYEGAGEELADRAMAVAAEATGTDTAPEA